MTTPQQQILDKCNAVFAVAKEKFGLDMSKVSIRFDLTGRSAGMAGYRRGGWGDPHKFFMRFNHDMLTRDAFDHVLTNTVPHEIAHLVCYMKPELGSNHDRGWARVCAALGGNATRCHKEAVVYGKGYTYEYITDRGHTVRVGDKHHAAVQRGQSLTYKKGKGSITAQCAYSIVGHQGRTLTTPIVKKTQTVSATGVSSPALTRHTPTQSIIGVAPAVRPPAKARTIAPVTLAMGGSKASVSRSIMLAGHGQGKSYEEIITAMMAACGYDRQLARATYKANCQKVGVPMPA